MKTFSKRWVLLGNSSESEKIWGVRPIEFPCGYHIPDISYVSDFNPLIIPRDKTNFCLMAGFAFEVSKSGKHISLEDADTFIRGYRPWSAIFYDYLLDDLRERNHTIMVWDRGVSIFYGLWREASQSLGPVVDPQDFSPYADQSVRLSVDGIDHPGSSFSQYKHKPSEIIHFMSQFMTLSPGDIFVLGPLVSTYLNPADYNTRFSVGDLYHDVELS